VAWLVLPSYFTLWLKIPRFLCLKRHKQLRQGICTVILRTLNSFIMLVNKYQPWQVSLALAHPAVGHQARHHPAAAICYAVPASPEPELPADVQVQPSDGPYVVCYAASLILLEQDFLQQT